jgi:hypothetical protein
MENPNAPVRLEDWVLLKRQEMPILSQFFGKKPIRAIFRAVTYLLPLSGSVLISFLRIWGRTSPCL